VTPDAYRQETQWKVPTYRDRLRWLTRRIPLRGGRAVDVGTRDGWIVKLLVDMGWQAVGYDPDDRWREYVQELGVDVRYEPFTAEAVGRGTLDLVTAYHVLEHIREPLPWMSEIRQALRPGGFVHMETPNLRRVRATQIIRSHTALYTAHTLRQLLETSGFRVVVITEYAPSGHRSYDCLGVLAQRDHPQPPRFVVSEFDRAVQRYLDHPTRDIQASRLPLTTLHRRLKRRAGAAWRKARYHAALPLKASRGTIPTT
jgi:SAM-dependent methyltransferase